jgi:hypothetical protein
MSEMEYARGATSASTISRDRITVPIGSIRFANLIAATMSTHPETAGQRARR